MKLRPITVAETELFLQQAAALWSEGEYDAFVEYIANNPEVGDLIPDTGGVRKVRWGRQGMGKRGGVRVIYFYHNNLSPLYLLMMYAKSARVDLSPQGKKTVKNFVASLKRRYQN